MTLSLKKYDFINRSVLIKFNKMSDLTKQDVINCMFSEWYPKFSRFTIKSYIVPLPDDFVRYLQEDGTIILPKGAELGLQRQKQDDSDNEDDWSDEETEDSVPEFTELIKQINETLEKLNWKAFPKLNWSSPKDAVWITVTNNLKCTTPGDIILLLKSSDFITYDLTSPFKLCCGDSSLDPPLQRNLVLRKWANLVLGMEFRCFVRDHKLVAACQRHCGQYYDYVEKQKDTLPLEICNFFKKNIEGKFPNSNFVLDIYKRRDGNYWIIDFNPWGPMTDPQLFTWSELNSLDISKISEEDCPLITSDGETIGVFRCTKQGTIMQPCETLSNRMPQDFLDLTRGEDATKLVDFFRMKIQDENGDSSDDDAPWQL